ncbi:hypothetical protein ACHAWF_004714 [Thalassiosira exigua]
MLVFDANVCLIVAFLLSGCHGFLLQSRGLCAGCECPKLSLCVNQIKRVHRTATAAPSASGTSTTRLFMGDHSSATIFQVGDRVTVVEDVMKAGKNLKGLSGTVVETWEKCEVDPTCCCAEWVDEGLSVHVRFVVDGNGNDLFANDNFVHYFAESELVSEKLDSDPVAFDGLSCKAFKLDKLSMGAQAKRIADFEKSREMKS